MVRSVRSTAVDTADTGRYRILIQADTGWLIQVIQALIHVIQVIQAHVLNLAWSQPRS